jgi:hypothetical protein
MTNPTPLAQAKAHASKLTIANVTEADYAYIRAYVFTHGYPAAVDIYGEPFVRAAMLPEDLGAMTSRRTVTRWVTPEGARLALVHLTHTSGNAGRRGLRDGGTRDGWWLIVRHPASGNTVAEHYLGATVPEAQLAAALAAVNAIPELPRPTEGATQ